MSRIPKRGRVFVYVCACVGGGARGLVRKCMVREACAPSSLRRAGVPACGSMSGGRRPCFPLLLLQRPWPCQQGPPHSLRSLLLPPLGPRLPPLPSPPNNAHCRARATLAHKQKPRQQWLNPDLMLTWQQSPTPVLVYNTSSMDVVRAACGSRHAALVTRSGEVYTWGFGKSECPSSSSWGAGRGRLATLWRLPCSD